MTAAAAMAAAEAMEGATEVREAAGEAAEGKGGSTPAAERRAPCSAATSHTVNRSTVRHSRGSLASDVSEVDEENLSPSGTATDRDRYRQRTQTEYLD